MTVSPGGRALIVRLANDAFADTIATGATASALREIGTLLADRHDYGITVRGSAESTASPESAVRDAALIRAVASGLVAGGVESRRIRFAKAPAPGSLGAVAIEIMPAP
jgi:hypothetical protein